MKILVATDGSVFSKSAIDMLANIIAKPENTSLKIISAVEHPTPMAAEPFAVSAEYYNEMAQMLRKQAMQSVKQAETEIRSFFSGGLLDVTTEVLDGSPQSVIVETAQEWGANLIVVGSHGYGFWSRALLGSVSNSIVQHAPCSVLVVRTETPEK